MRRMIKRLGAVAAVILLLSGCTQQEAQKEQEEQPRTMSMVIASDAPTSIQLAAQEFANRLAYYSDGELEISLSASDQLDAVLTADDTQFAFVENERLSKTIEPLETFTLPFFFQDADYLFSGLNSERTRGQLNRLLEEEYPMEIQMSVVYGYEDLAADATVDLTDFRKRYPLAVTRSFFSQEQQQEIGALEIEGEEPLQMLLDKEVEIAPVELSELVQTVQSQDSALVLLESSHQLKPAYLMMQTGLYEQLTPKQQRGADADVAFGKRAATPDAAEQRLPAQAKREGWRVGKNAGPASQGKANCRLQEQSQSIYLPLSFHFLLHRFNILCPLVCPKSLKG